MASSNAAELLLARADGQWPEDIDPASLQCRDDEHRTGATLRSKNRLFKSIGTFV